MKVFSLIVALLVPILAAAQAPPPQLGTITPDTLPATGGLEVVITGQHLDLPPGYACIAECPPRVRFGDHEVTAHAYTDTQLIVRTPPHPAGLAGVTVITGDGRTVSRPAAVTYTASPEEAWELVLIPIHLEDAARGANGSIWLSQFWLRNNGATDVTIAPWPCPDGEACPPVFPSQRSFAPGESHGALPRSHTRSANPGRLLFVQGGRGADVAFSLRVLDETRPSSGAGTEIPVVRAASLRGTPIHLLNVPFEPTRYRYTLRIYDTARVPARFVARVFEQVEQRSESPLAEVYVTTSLTDPSPLFPFEPAYAGVDITRIIPVDRIGRPLRVEVVPLQPYSRFWAMLTITGDGGAPTVVSPQ